jgi:hypothetical protein
MNQKNLIQCVWYGCQMLGPLDELLGFERNKIMEKKKKSLHFP